MSPCRHTDVEQMKMAHDECLTCMRTRLKVADALVEQLEIDTCPSREAALRLEARLIRELRPPFNLRLGVEPRRRRGPLHLRCDRCSCVYLEEPDLDILLGAPCGDNPTGRRPCPGRLVADDREVMR